MLNYKRYKRVPVVHYPERRVAGQRDPEGTDLVQCRSARRQSGADRANGC